MAKHQRLNKSEFKAAVYTGPHIWAKGNLCCLLLLHILHASAFALTDKEEKKNGSKLTVTSDEGVYSKEPIGHGGGVQQSKGDLQGSLLGRGLIN